MIAGARGLPYVLTFALIGLVVAMSVLLTRTGSEPFPTFRAPYFSGSPRVGEIASWVEVRVSVEDETGTAQAIALDEFLPTTNVVRTDVLRSAFLDRDGAVHRLRWTATGRAAGAGRTGAPDRAESPTSIRWLTDRASALRPDLAVTALVVEEVRLSLDLSSDHRTVTEQTFRQRRVTLTGGS